jgi:hypothetical protein
MRLNRHLPGSISRRLKYGDRLPGPGRIIAGLSLLMTGLVLASGCTAVADNAIAVSLEQNFDLQIGQSALASSENLQVDFLAVTEDSRCGKGETCVWEGDGSVRIALQIAGGARAEHELHTNSRMQAAVDVANFSIGLVALNPPAISGRAIERSEYVATFRIVRGSSGGKVVY